MPRVLGALNLSTRSCMLVIAVPMIAATIVLRIVFAFVPTPRPDMTLQADGLVETGSVADAQPHTAMPILMPDDLLGGTVYTVAAYTEGAGALPVGSVSVTVVKNGWRFVEIVERPGTTVADAVDDYVGASSARIALGDATGTLLFLSTRNIPCVSPNEKFDLPGFCEVERALFFERGGVVYSVAADGGHATDGELILLAKDMLD